MVQTNVAQYKINILDSNSGFNSISKEERTPTLVKTNSFLEEDSGSYMDSLHRCL